MRKFILFGLFGLAVSISGCVAMQDDVTTLHERVVTAETKLGSLEKESQQSISTFEGDWTPKVASLSEDMLVLRERIASTEGSVSTLTEQIRQETEKSEKFRSATSQELIDFQNGISGRLNQMRQELELVKKTQAETAVLLEEVKKRTDEISFECAAISDRVEQVDTGLTITRDESAQKLSIIVEEVSKENQALRERIAALEKKVFGKAKSKPKD